MQRKKNCVTLRTFGTVCYTDMFTYSTVRSATIESKPVALLHRTVQIAILCYIIGYDILWNKGYQITDTATSTVTTKVKGLGYTNDSKIYKIYENIPNSLRVFDTSDYIIPPNEFNSFFVMTNFVETIQTLGFCDEAPDKYGAICKNDSDCPSNQTISNTWSGIPTGRCVPSYILNGTNTCEINAWCPVEDDITITTQNLIKNSLSYTVFIKNDVEFKKFKKKERNILQNITNSYISTCRYNAETSPYCPVFEINDILTAAEPNELEREKMLERGGVVEIGMNWDCNYDLFKAGCMPTVEFHRFDVPFSKSKSSSSGFNFRFSNKYMINGIEHRTLIKAYGLRFVINVSGNAGRFSIIPLMLTIGAGVGLLSISEFVADYYLLNFSNKRKLFKKVKELNVKNVIASNTEEAEENKSDLNMIETANIAKNSDPISPINNNRTHKKRHSSVNSECSYVTIVNNMGTTYANKYLVPVPTTSIPSSVANINENDNYKALINSRVINQKSPKHNNTNKDFADSHADRSISGHVLLNTGINGGCGQSPRRISYSTNIQPISENNKNERYEFDCV